MGEKPGEEIPSQVDERFLRKSFEESYFPILDQVLERYFIKSRDDFVATGEKGKLSIEQHAELAAVCDFVQAGTTITGNKTLSSQAVGTEQLVYKNLLEGFPQGLTGLLVDKIAQCIEAGVVMWRQTLKEQLDSDCHKMSRDGKYADWFNPVWFDDYWSRVDEPRTKEDFLRTLSRGKGIRSPKS